MSGIFGYAGVPGVARGQEALDKMADALPVHTPMQRLDWTNAELAVGFCALHPERINGGDRLAEDSITSVSCVLDGFVFPEAHGDGERIRSGGAALLLESYLKFGLDCLPRLSGSFNFALWDGRSKELVVGADKLGQRLMYFSANDGRFAFGSSLANIMATDIPNRDIDLDGFSDLLNYGYILGEGTLFRKVQNLPPGNFLIVKEGKINVSEYWRLDAIEPHGHYNEGRLDELEHHFRVAVRRSMPDDLACAIGMTGGQDSRCILAAAINSDLRFVTHTGGQPDSTDVDIARQISRHVDVEHVFENLGPERIYEWLEPMVLHQGGMVATLNSHPCQHFDADFEFDAIVQGIGATYSRGNWVTGTNLNVESMDDVQACLERAISTPTLKRLTADQLWQPAHMPESARSPGAQLRALMDECQLVDSPIAVIDYIANRERVRKFLNKAIVIVRNCREAFYPFLDHQFIAAVATLPVADRIRNRILVDMIGRWQPKLLDFDYEKNLMPMSCSRNQRLKIRASRAIRRRLARKFRFVNPPREKIANHSYADWSRREMRADLNTLLYNPDAAFRAYLRWDTIQIALEEHFAGKQNWESLISALVVFEIAHRLWVNPVNK